VVKVKSGADEGSSHDRLPDGEPERTTRTGQGRQQGLACAGDGNEWMLATARALPCLSTTLYSVARSTLLPASACRRRGRSHERAARNEAPLCTAARGSWSHVATWQSDSSCRMEDGKSGVAELQIGLESNTLC
jgi:hypothetical protein